MASRAAKLITTFGIVATMSVQAQNLQTPDPVIVKSEPIKIYAPLRQGEYKLGNGTCIAGLDTFTCKTPQLTQGERQSLVRAAKLIREEILQKDGSALKVRDLKKYTALLRQINIFMAENSTGSNLSRLVTERNDVADNTKGLEKQRLFSDAEHTYEALFIIDNALGFYKAAGEDTKQVDWNHTRAVVNDQLNRVYK